jgi:hypothetical protein
MAIRSDLDGGEVTTKDSLIRSRPGVLKNPVTVLFDMLLAADNILSRTEAGDGALTTIKKSIISPCFAITPDQANADKTSEHSAPGPSIPIILDDPSARNHQPLKPRAVPVLTHAYNTGSTSATTNVLGFRPIPPPPRLPSVPMGFAYSSGTLPYCPLSSDSISRTSSQARSNVSKQY